MSRRKNSIKVDIKRCARCGKNHKQLVFKEFTYPPKVYSYWGMCPVVKEPVLMEIFDTDDIVELDPTKEY